VLWYSFSGKQARYSVISSFGVHFNLFHNRSSSVLVGVLNGQNKGIK